MPQSGPEKSASTLIDEKIRELGAKPAFKGYYDYPCVLCTSVNNEIIHAHRDKIDADCVM